MTCNCKAPSYCVYCRHEAYKKFTQPLPLKKQQLLEQYRNGPIRKAIDLATKYDYNLHSLENFESLKEALGYELTLKYHQLIINNKPKAVIYAISFDYANTRKYSWYDHSIWRKETCQIHADGNLVVYSDNGDVIDYAEVPDSLPTLGLPNPYRLPPDTFLEKIEDYEKIIKLPADIGSQRGNWAKKRQKVIEAILSGINVLPKNSDKLNLPKDKIKTLKHQAIKKAMQLFADYDEESYFRQKLKAIKRDENKKGKRRKTSLAKRKELYRYRDPHYFPPRLIRHWNVLTGGKAEASKPCYQGPE